MDQQYGAGTFNTINYSSYREKLPLDCQRAAPGNLGSSQYSNWNIRIFSLNNL